MFDDWIEFVPDEWVELIGDDFGDGVAHVVCKE